jgi:PilZ domain
MVAVRAGDRVVLRTDDGYVTLRALRAQELVGPWRLPVLVLLAQWRPTTGTLELARDGGGVIRLPARIALVDGALTLLAGHGAPAPPPESLLSGEQRRGNVRGELHLPLRATAVDARGDDVLHGGVLGGHTLDVSAGGARVDLPDLGCRLPNGVRLYLEIEMPGGQLAPVVVTVVRSEGGGVVQVRFDDIAPVDREQLVRLVFEAERRLLAERRARLT